MNYLKDLQHIQRVLKELAMEIPDEMAPFNNIHKINATTGQLSAKTKELMSLALAIAANSDGCISIHIKSALDEGASRKEIIETIGVTIMSSGSAAVMAGCKAFEALKFIRKNQEPALLYDEV